MYLKHSSHGYYKAGTSQLDDRLKPPKFMYLKVNLAVFFSSFIIAVKVPSREVKLYYPETRCQLNQITLQRTGSGMRQSHIQWRESDLLFDFGLLSEYSPDKSDTVSIEQGIHRSDISCFSLICNVEFK